MPLTWDLTDCEDYKSLQTDDEWGITQTLIFCTMHTGIGHLTEKNADEFYARVHFLEQLNGGLILATRNGKRIDRPLMPLDIKRRIGLRTNASFKDESRTSFVKRHVTNGALRDGIYRYREAVRHDFDGSLYQFIEPEDDAAVAS